MRIGSGRRRKDRNPQSILHPRDYAAEHGAHLRSAGTSRDGKGRRQALDGRTGRAQLPQTGADKGDRDPSRRHDRRVQHRLRRRTRTHAGSPEGRRRPRFHGHRPGGHHGRRRRGEPAGERRKTPERELRRLALPPLRFHGRAVALQGACDGRLRRCSQEHLDRHRVVGRESVDTLGGQDQKRRRNVERPPGAGRFSGVDGRVGQVGPTTAATGFSTSA